MSNFNLFCFTACVFGDVCGSFAQPWPRRRSLRRSLRSGASRISKKTGACSEQVQLRAPFVCSRLYRPRSEGIRSEGGCSMEQSR